MSRKGPSYELDISHRIAEAFGLDREQDIPRVPNSGGLMEKGDLHKSDRLKRFFPFHIECKNQKTVRLWSFMDDSEGDAPEGDVPIVILHRHRTSKDYVVIGLDDFLTYIKDYVVAKDQTTT